MNCDLAKKAQPFRVANEGGRGLIYVALSFISDWALVFERVQNSIAKRTLKKSFKIRSVQKLDGNEIRRIEFFENKMKKYHMNPRIKSRIIFTDECRWLL